MPYSIQTKDNITIDNIPDDVGPDSDVLKERVAKIRAERNTTEAPTKAPEAPSELTFGRGAELVGRGSAEGVISGAGALAGAQLGGMAGAAISGPAAPIGGTIGAIGGGLIGAFAPDWIAGKQIERLKDKIGLAPQNKSEKIIEGVANAGTSVMSPMGILKTGAAKLVSPAVKAAMTTEPGMQVGSAAFGAVASEATENPFVGLIAGLSPALIKRGFSGFSKDPKEIAARLWKEALAIKDENGKTIGYHLPDSDVGLQLRRQLEGENGQKHLMSLLEKNVDDLGQTIPKDASITAPVAAGQTARAGRVAVAEQAAEATNLANQSAVDTAATNAKTNLQTVLKRPADVKESSIGAANTIGVLEEKVKKQESKLWKPITDVNPRIPAGMKEVRQVTPDGEEITRRGIAEELNVYEGGLDEVAKGVTKPLRDHFSLLVDKYKGDIPFNELKAFNSLAMREMRNEKYGSTEKRILRGFVESLNKGLDSSVQENAAFNPAFKEAYRSAQSFTSERYKKFGDSYLESALNEGKTSGAPSELIGNIVAGKGNEEKITALTNLLTPMQHPEGKSLSGDFKRAAANITKSVDDYIADDMVTRLGVDGLADEKKIGNFIREYQSVFKASPTLRAKYANIQKAQEAAFKAVQTKAQQVEAAQVAEVSTFFGKNVDATSPTKVQSAFKTAIDSTDQDSITKILSQIDPQNVDARDGLKRIALNHILDDNGGAKAHEIIAANSGKFDQIFDTPEQKEFLRKISESSELLDRYNKVDKKEQAKIAKLLSDTGYLPIIFGKTRTYGTLAATGAGAGLALAGLTGIPLVGPAVTASVIATGAGNALGGGGTIAKKAIRMLGGAKRDQVVNVLKEAMMDPQRAKDLMTPGSSKAANFIMPMISGARGAMTYKEDDKQVQKYASGGPVYTPSAINSIRSARAQRNFAQ